MQKVLLLLTFLICNSTFAKHPKLPKHFAGTCDVHNEFCAYMAPTDLPLEAVKGYLKMAKKSIRIATYNISVKELGNIILKKAKEGVKVEYLIDYKNSWTNKLWSSLNHPNIIKMRLPIFTGSNPQMHNKIIIIDDEVAVSGSANFSYFGLLANFENVMAISKKDVVKKFNTEIDEMKAIAEVTCNTFARSNCHDGGWHWEDDIAFLLQKGGFKRSDIHWNNKDCRQLAYVNKKDVNELWSKEDHDDYYGILPTDDAETIKAKKKRWIKNAVGIAYPTNLIKNYDLIKTCLKKSGQAERIKGLFDKISEIERYEDGTLTKSQTRYWKKDDSQVGQKYRVYFSPEDNVEKRLLDELHKTLEDPKNSYAYISTNFITNKRITQKILQMHAAGVRLRVFFDRGRFQDPNFKMRLKDLSKLGYFGDKNIINPTLNGIGAQNPHPANDLRNLVTIFHNDLTGDFACNHNKMAVVGTGKEMTLINGSANWSGSAMTKNGENLVIVKDNAIASIYLREILAQLKTYRYGGKSDNPGFEDELSYLQDKSQCLPALMQDFKTCQVDGKTWDPNNINAAILSISEIPVTEQLKNLYVWVPQLNNNKGGAVKAYSHEYFAGKWLTAVPLPPNWRFDFKFFLLPDGVNPNDTNLHWRGVWERGGAGNDRQMQLENTSGHTIREKYIWGQY